MSIDILSDPSEMLPPRRKRQRQQRRARQHAYNGFPHFSRKNPGHCMCLDFCCMGESGCICKTCPCQSGQPHGDVYPQFTQEEPLTDEEQEIYERLVNG